MRFLSGSRDKRRLRCDGVERSWIFRAETIQTKHPQNGTTFLIPVHFPKGFGKHVQTNLIDRNFWRGNRRKTKPLGCSQNAGILCQIGVDLGNDVINVAVH